MHMWRENCMTIFKIFKRDFPKVLKNAHSCLLLSGTQLILRRINAITFLPLLHCIKQQINCTISKPCIINYWKHKKCPAWWQYISVDSQHTFCQATQYLPATYNVHTKL